MIPILIIFLASLTLFISNPAYAPCAIGPNGTEECAGPPPMLDQIKSDKLNYEISEKPLITITGTSQTLTHLEVDDSSSGNIRFSHDINLSSNGTASYILDVSAYPPGVYQITATSSVSKITTSFTVGLEPVGGHIMFNIVKNSYFPGDHVPIFGTYTANSTIQLSLSDPHGVVVKSVQTVANKTGYFSSSDIQIPTNAIPGVWRTSATSGVFHTNMEINVVSSIAVGPTNPVDISNIRIQPSTVKVGDKFAITATLLNNSPNSISIGISPCGEPFPISFDNHIIIYQEENVTCAYYILEERIDPGKNTTQTSPGAPITTGKPMVNTPQTVFFKAVQAGIENATISFAYNIMNQVDSNQSQIQKTASKSFLFMIYDNKTDLSNGLYTDQMVTNTIDSPLQQLRSGIKSEDVQCNIDFQLILKGSDNTPACIKKSDMSDFMSRTWATREISVENIGQSFNYTIVGGQIEQAKEDLASKSLVVTVKTTENGTLVASIPRSLLDPHMNGQDTAFIVLGDGKEISFSQTMTTITQRTLNIPFQYGVSTIEIIAPEPIR